MSKHLRYLAAGLRITLAPLTTRKAWLVPLEGCLMFVVSVVWVSALMVLAYGVAYLVITAMQIGLLPLMFPDPEPGPILNAWLAFRLPHGEYAGAVVVVVICGAWLKEICRRGERAIKSDLQAGLVGSGDNSDRERI
ncbi:hypothetical protein [Azonexus hydrophilus]|uniref:Uncharacterized protein n=1 Tax=Azonexus hydrophilus TaxID=418702 RepID=A0ABZ2XL65_9RHOO